MVVLSRWKMLFMNLIQRYEFIVHTQAMVSLFKVGYLDAVP